MILFSVLESLALSAVGALTLWGLYRALELNWPEQYVSLNDTFALRVTQAWWRFLVYRFVPVFVAGVGIWATASRLRLIPILAVIAMTLIHVLQTNVRALFESFGMLQQPKRFTINYASYHLIVIGIIAVATVCAILLGPTFAVLVPKPQTLLENLWIAIFVAIAGGIAVAVIGRRPSDANGFDEDYFIWRAKRDVPIELTDAAFEAAIEFGCDPVLLRAIMFAEALQRPSWIRRLERVKGKIIPHGSYGVTQETSSRPIGDVEAIRITASKLSHAWSMVEHQYGWTADDGLVWKFASNHNEDVAFIEGVRKLLPFVQKDRLSAPYNTPECLHLIETRRYPHEFGLRGLTTADEIRYVEATISTGLLFGSLQRPTISLVGEPWAFELKMPVDTTKVDFQIQTSTGEIPFSMTVTAASYKR